jgi:hypothetical protein
MIKSLIPVTIRNSAYVLKSQFKYRLWSALGSGSIHREKLRRLKGAHVGRRCFIIGNGPSLVKTDVTKLYGEITIGSNGIFLLKNKVGFYPTYYTIEDHLVAEDRASEAASFIGPIKLFPYDLNYSLRCCTDATFFYFHRKLVNGEPRFVPDLVTGAHFGGTVTYLNLQLAVFLGCDPIYLIGVDHSYNTNFAINKDGSVWTSNEDDQNHFDKSYFGKGYRWHDPQVERMEASYRAARAYAARSGITIANATAGGMLEVFPRVQFDHIVR